MVGLNIAQYMDYNMVLLHCYKIDMYCNSLKTTKHLIEIIKKIKYYSFIYFQIFAKYTSWKISNAGKYGNYKLQWYLCVHPQAVPHLGTYTEQDEYQTNFSLKK